jgi:8-oxo-dGTP pyrophosphatase MutT (NUDIX family)
VPLSAHEAADVARLRDAATEGDVFSRAAGLHVTASALVVHVPTRRVLLRWHPKMRQWMQVGGHFDAGETDPWSVALREAREETGLDDLASLTASPRCVQIVIVPVPIFGTELAHEHADLRYALTTDHPDSIRAETRAAGLRWMPIKTAGAEVEEENLRAFIARVAAAVESAADYE